MGPPSRVEARPVLGSLRSQGIEPFLVLRDFCFSYFEFVATQGHRLENARYVKQEKRDDKCSHDSLRSDICVVSNARALPFAARFSRARSIRQNLRNPALFRQHGDWNPLFAAEPHSINSPIGQSGYLSTHNIAHDERKSSSTGLRVVECFGKFASLR